MDTCCHVTAQRMSTIVTALLFLFKYLSDLFFVLSHDWKPFPVADRIVMKSIVLIIMEIRVYPSLGQ